MKMDLRLVTNRLKAQEITNKMGLSTLSTQVN